MGVKYLYVKISPFVIFPKFIRCYMSNCALSSEFAVLYENFSSFTDGLVLTLWQVSVRIFAVTSLTSL